MIAQHERQLQQTLLPASINSSILPTPNVPATNPSTSAVVAVSRPNGSNLFKKQIICTHWKTGTWS